MERMDIVMISSTHRTAGVQGLIVATRRTKMLCLDPPNFITFGARVQLYIFRLG